MLQKMKLLVCFYLGLILENINAQIWHQHNSHEYFVSKKFGENFSENILQCNSLQAEVVMIKTLDVQNFLKGLLAADYPTGTNDNIFQSCFRELLSIFCLSNITIIDHIKNTLSNIDKL